MSLRVMKTKRRSDEINETYRAYRENICLHDLVDEQVCRTPQASALVFEDQSLTYRELGSLSNQLAQTLRARGVTSDMLVGVCMQRSLELPVALLSIIKAGGAYVPLDPDYPQERLLQIVDDAQPRLILTQKQLREKLPWMFAENATTQGRMPATICVDELSENYDHETVALTNESRPEDLAYVIYTSGSTGKPKGVMNTHRAICNRLLWMQDEYQLAGDDAVMQKTPSSFDVSVWEFFWPLMTGARLVLARPGGHLDSHYMADLIEQHQITVMHFVPSMLRAFLQEPKLERCRSLRDVICSGEALTRDVQDLFFQCCDSRLHNLYGPTEAAVDVTYWECQPDTSYATVPIGRPVANTQIHLLDEQLQPVPIGVAGELHIGGVQVARGYLNQPELTEQKFIPDPFCKDPEARLYKTGDLARSLSDGNIEFLGRMDHQVKVRGFRIELGEIETRLQEYPGLVQATVVMHEPAIGDQRLAAYYTMRNGQKAPESSDLRDHVGAFLPDYMVPQYFTFLTIMPLTPNGKTDRSALPAPAISADQDPSTFPARRIAASPRDALELQLCHIWELLLRVKPVGIHDDFFELGGHSLLAVRLMVQIEQLHGKRLPLATLLQSRTVEALANILRAEDWKPTWNCLVPMRGGGIKPPLFLMHSHGGNVLEYDPLVERLGEDQPVYALQARGLGGDIDADPSIEDMAAYYIAELKSLQPEGPYYLGGFCFGGLLALESACQLRDQGDEVAHVILIQTQAVEYPLDLPHVTALHRAAYRFLKRVDLERSNVSVMGGRAKLNYFWHRLKRFVEIGRGRATVASESLLNAFGVKRPNGSTPYVLAVLANAHEKARLKYLAPTYDGRVSLFRAQKQRRGIRPDETLGWRNHLTGQFDVYEVPGHQQNMLNESNVGTLAKNINTCLAADPSAEITLRQSNSKISPLADDLTIDERKLDLV